MAAKLGSSRTTSVFPVLMLNAAMFPYHESAKSSVSWFKVAIPLGIAISGSSAIMLTFVVFSFWLRSSFHSEYFCKVGRYSGADLETITANTFFLNSVMPKAPVAFGKVAMVENVAGEVCG